jgi:hypothetical protein
MEKESSKKALTNGDEGFVMIIQRENKVGKKKISHQDVQKNSFTTLISLFRYACSHYTSCLLMLYKM